MGHGRLRWGLVAGAVLVASVGLPAPVSADPGTVPVIIAPEPPGPVSVSGDVEITVSSSPPANSVQFYLDDDAYGPQVALSGSTASAQWPTWSRPNGDYTWTAVDCDEISCNTIPSAPLLLTVANAPPTITAPTDGATVAGEVTVTATTAAPLVQFYLDSVEFGEPVAGNGVSASVQWPTWSLPDGAHSWTAADCDINGCNLSQSTAVDMTIDNTAPTITAPADTSTVSGDVTVSVTTAAPSVQFYVDTVPLLGTPMPVSLGSASTVWSTSALADGAHTVAVAECDGNGCNATQSSVTVTTVNTGPTITPDGETVTGVVNIDAATVASQVQFSLDGNEVDGPVAVTAGKASITWTTWGLANGSHSWTAAAVCDNPGCTPPESTVSVTLDNTAPAITSPANGAVTGSTISIVATSSGGGLAFFLDGEQVGFDATAPYSFTVSTPLNQGSHIVSVKQCDTAGTACSGPSSTTTSFTVGKLSPSITSVAPNPFSPGTGSPKDRTSFRVRLPEAQQLTWRVKNQNGETVDGPHWRGLQAAGTHTYQWNGRNNAGRVVPDGIYALVVNTATGSGTTLLEGAHSATVRVDHTRTSFAAVTGVNSTVYPVRDGYLDAFRPRVRVSEGGRLWMVISTPRGKRLRKIARSHATKGTLRPGWNGRDAKNHLVPAGRYSFQFFAEDRAGNRSSSRRFPVRVSHRRTLQKTIAVHRRGDVGRVGATNARCTQYSFGFSSFEHGLWLDNFCDRGFDNAVIYADYSFAVPGAVHYDGIRVRTVGATYAPGPISVQVYNFTDSKWEGAGGTTLRTKSKVITSTFRRVSGAHRVSLRHRVRIRILVPNFRRQEDYDIARAGIVVSYRVLRSRPRR
jgi:flagellar hook assembly protein FlgD